MDRHTAGPIAIATVLGGGLVALAFCSFAHACPLGSTAVFCSMARTNPPWLLLTSLIAGPAALLTWYWRTQHKKVDILHAARGQVAQRFATAVEMLQKRELVGVGAIYALEQMAKDSPEDHWTVVETLAAFVRTLTFKDDPKRFCAQAAITVLGRRDSNRDRPGGIIDLSDACLVGVIFDRLNFARANFSNAAVDSASFCGTNLAGSTFRPRMLWTQEEDLYEQADAEDPAPWGDPPFFDNSTAAGEEQLGGLMTLKAINAHQDNRADRKAYLEDWWRRRMEEQRQARTEQSQRDKT